MNEPIQIIIISLEESVERRAKSPLQLDAAGLTWRFQDAIKGASLPSFPDEYDRSRRLRLTGWDMSLPEIGAFLSHRQAWKTCVETQKLTLVLEDDFLFEEDPVKVLDRVFESLPAFDVLRLQGIFHHHKYKILKDYGKTSLVRHFRDPSGMTAYVLKPAAAKKLLEASGFFYDAVDGYLGCYWVHRLKILSLFPFPVTSDGSPSTIQSETIAGRLDARQKFRMKLFKLPQSFAKRIHQAEVSIFELFTRAG